MVSVRLSFQVSWKYGLTCVNRYGSSGSPITWPVAGAPSKKSAHGSPGPACGGAYAPVVERIRDSELRQDLAQLGAFISAEDLVAYEARPDVVHQRGRHRPGV